MFVPASRSGSFNAHLSGMPSSPTAVNASPIKVRDAAATSCSATTISQSMTGLAARPGTEVLATCSMATTGTPTAAFASASRARPPAPAAGLGGGRQHHARLARQLGDPANVLACGCRAQLGPIAAGKFPEPVGLLSIPAAQRVGATLLGPARPGGRRLGGHP